MTLSPAVYKVDPTVLDMQVFGFLLDKSLVHEEQVASVVDFPDKTVFREFYCIGKRGTRSVFSETCGIYYK